MNLFAWVFVNNAVSIIALAHVSPAIFFYKNMCVCVNVMFLSELSDIYHVFAVYEYVVYCFD